MPTPPLSYQQEQQIKALSLLKSKLQSQTTTKLSSILSKTHQMQSTVNATNVELYNQSNQLQRIEKINKSTGHVLKKADETSKEMSSYWYYIGKKIKRIFVKEKDCDDEGNSKINISNIAINNSNSNSNSKVNKIHEYQNEGIRQQSTHTNNSLPKQQTSQSQQDMHLDQIYNQLKKLNSHAKATNTQLDKQFKLIQSIDRGIDKNSSKTQQINKRLKKNFF